MQKIVSKINSLGFPTVLLVGVGLPHVLFTKLKGEKLGFDKWDKTKYPRLWSHAVFGQNLTRKRTKKKFDLVILNDSRRYSDLDTDFNQALKNLKEGGTIAIIGTMPNMYDLVRPDPLPRQNWCGDAYIFVLDLISKGGYRVESFDLDLGISLITVDDSIQGKEITLGAWEDWYVERKTLMNNGTDSTN